MNVVCAAYYRVSMDDQSCASQKREVQQWIIRNGWTLLHEYEDQAVSGGKNDRPALNRLLLDARARKFDCIVVYKLDRLGRSVLHLSNTIKDLDRWGVRFVSISQNIDTDKSNPTSRLLLHILAAVAEWERETIRERTTAGVRAAIARGVRVGGPIKIFDRAIADRLHDQGKSLRAIAVELGVPFSTLRGDFKRRGKLEAIEPTSPAA